MSKINRHPVRRTAAGVLASALVLSGAVAAATPATAATGFALDRIAGDNRYETSARIAAEFGATSGAILASGETGHVVDALSANFLAGVRGVPVLLTTRDSIPASVMARLNALTGEKRVTIVGETQAVSASVEAQLRSMGFTVDRLGGADRYATSEAIIKAGASAAANVGLVASGTSFPDALAGGPLAYKGKHPVFLTAAGRLPQDTVDAIRASGVRSVIILGGTAAVPATVEGQLKDLGITIMQRLGGAGRSETSRIIADYLIANFGFTNTTFNLASGAPRLEGVDALSGGALSGKQNRALLITDTGTSAAPVVAFARDRAATLNAMGHIFGGPAAVAVALEEAIEAAGRNAAGPVTLTTASVAQGGNLTGTIAGDFSSVTVSGCGFDNQTVGADDNTTTEGRQFTLTVGAAQATGACTVTFTATPAGGGAAVTQTVEVMVTEGAVQSATARPELVSAQIVSTTTGTEVTPDNPAGTTVRYTFDEAIANAGGLQPTADEFFVYNADNTREGVAGSAGPPVVEAVPDGRFGGDAIVSVNGNSVTVRFDEVTTNDQAAQLSVATVDDGAVRDAEGNINPEGDAAVGATTGGGTQTLPAGTTAGPDLVSVGNFRQGQLAGQTAVDFTFDEAATAADAAFDAALVLLNGSAIDCDGPGSADTAVGGGTVAGGNGTTRITVTCDDGTPAAGERIFTAADVARGIVEVDEVIETTNDEANSTAQETNPLQAVDVSNVGNTTTPDLVSATFTQGADAAADTAIFTFDEVVTAVTTPAAFFAYDVNGDEIPGTASTISSDGTRVLVTFAGGTSLDRAVGASVRDGAVTGTNPAGSTNGDVSVRDEVGVANSTTAVSQTAGRTDAPDLTTVDVGRGPSTTDAFGRVTQGDFRAVYTFDEDVTAVDPTDFFLFLADGTRLTGGTCAITTATAPQTADDVDNTVTCTAFTGGTGTAEEQNAQIGTATLGTVDFNAVTEEAGTLPNPEGAAFTTGGTGTPVA